MNRYCITIQYKHIRFQLNTEVNPTYVIMASSLIWHIPRITFALLAFGYNLTNEDSVNSLRLFQWLAPRLNINMLSYQYGDYHVARGLRVKKRPNIYTADKSAKIFLGLG